MENDLEILRHSSAHLMASAVVNLYPEALLTIGPAIKDGFYYDIDFKSPISEADVPKIEAEMERIKGLGESFNRKEIGLTEARKIFKNNPYKLELIDEISKSEDKAPLSTYKMGGFVDHCRGPHVKNTKEIGCFKLVSVAGAYWRGDSKNKMLTRIYGVAFKTKEELDKYLWQVEEAKKRDHRKIGKDLDLFSVDDYVGPGLVLWHPKLSFVREKIEFYWREEHRKRGYQYVYTPHVGLAHLWETSGHLDFFKEGMYPSMAMEVKSKEEKTNYYVKPMNCPFHVRIYKSRIRSYRELPLRWCELGTVYRYEESGVLHGMLRVRGFTQDDAHIICREDQFIDEVNQIIDFAIAINHTFGFDKLNVYLSLRDLTGDKKYVGENRVWELSEKTLKEVLEKRKIEFKEDIGGAKFYGPSIDFKAVDSMGREWQGTTIQLDMNLPSRFGMTYVGEDGKEHTPIMIHRTLLGAMERFVGTLIEQCAGAFPVWLTPTQTMIIPISDKHVDYCQKLKETLENEGVRTELDDRKESMQSRIRDAQMQKIPYMLILGDKEIEANQISLRLRTGENIGSLDLKTFIKTVKEIDTSKAVDKIWNS